MKTGIKRIALYPNIDRDTDLNATKYVARELIDCGIEVVADRCFKELLDMPLRLLDADSVAGSADMLIALGGDGTFLRTARIAAERDIPVMGINVGHLGFLTQAENGDSEVFKKLADADFTLSETMLIEARVIDEDNNVIDSFTALNDIIIKSPNSKMLSLEVCVDGTMTNKCNADGLIVASATGSTAYSLSCGGPIVHPELECMIITPICPHTLKSRCIITPPDKKITVRSDFTYSGEVTLRTDGESVFTLGKGMYAELVKASNSVKLVNLSGRSYFDVIRRKLAD